MFLALSRVSQAPIRIRGTITTVRAARRGFTLEMRSWVLPKDSEVSTEVAKRLADFYLNDPFEIAAERWVTHYPFMKASANQFRQDAERLGEKLEAADVGV